MRGFVGETYFAKEDMHWNGCRGKLLGCSYEVYWGLQCGLSGNLVISMATRYK